MSKILAFSGKLSSGKTTCCNIIYSIALMTTIRDKEGNALTDKAWVDPESGKLMVGVSPEEYIHLDLDSRDPEVVTRLAENIWPFIRKFSCATPLKEFCVDILGLNPDHVYGTQEDKKNLTHLKWEDMPAPRGELMFREGKVVNGPMTVREVLEYFGTEIVRKMYPKAWAKGLIKYINKWNPIGAVVDDVRFVDEVESIKEAGGKVVRLTRITEDAVKNNHQSNVELDNYENWDAVIDNNNMTIDELFNAVVSLLVDIEWLGEASAS